MPPPEIGQYFRRLFTPLSGIESGAYHWQEDLFGDFLDDIWPVNVCLPTGLGKTSVMHVWLLALAWEAAHRPQKRTVPTRLVWVVDRRVVVDQATAEADRIADRIKEPECEELRTALMSLSIAGCSGSAPAVSTLRGERADNRAWSLDPSRPAIIVGTVDMTGSRLLFSGYGDGRRRRASHAALLGQDSLIVNDEAHLTPAFANLLDRLREVAGGKRPPRAMLLSATPRDTARPSFPQSLHEDLKNQQFRKRYRAVKRLHLAEHEDPQPEIQRLAAESDRRTLVFVRSPEEARKLAAAIESKHKGASVPLITGMQRGWERDQLLAHPTVQRYLSKDPPPADGDPCWMVATSAGEVGIDLSCDRLITDLDTTDHLLQRFGRLNRFGETEGDAHVVYSKKQVMGDKGDPRLAATLDYLKKFANVSPEELKTAPPSAAALSEAPHFASLLPWHIDVWSMTSISAQEWPSRPPVEHWLRGDDERGAPPETYVAWRSDVEDLAKPGVSPRDRDEIFDCYPVLAQERLKQYTRALCTALEKSKHLDKPAILIAADGEIHAASLAELIQDESRLRYGTLVLPPCAGYLDENGMVDWTKSTAGLSPGELDRYDKSGTGTRERIRVAPGEPEPEPRFRRRYSVRIPVEDESEEGPRWIYFEGEPPRRTAKPGEELLATHAERVAKLATDLARRAGFDERLIHVFEWAGRWHDAGKDRPIWQHAAGNPDGSAPLAKTGRLCGRAMEGYRHELGSLLDAESRVPADFTEHECDLALHLLSAHHGWARPHFPDRAFDKRAYRRSERAALECARRFGRLQQRHGAWGLAYLETIFRSADAIASANGAEQPAND